MIERFLFSWKRATHPSVNRREKGWGSYVLYLVFVINNQILNATQTAQRDIAFCFKPSIELLESKIQNDKQYDDRRRWLLFTKGNVGKKKKKGEKTNKMIDFIHSQFNAHVLQQCVKSRGCHVKHVIVYVHHFTFTRAHRRWIVKDKRKKNTKRKKKEESFSLFLSSSDWNQLIKTY